LCLAQFWQNPQKFVEFSPHPISPSINALNEKTRRPRRLCALMSAAPLFSSNPPPLLPLPTAGSSQWMFSLPGLGEMFFSSFFSTTLLVPQRQEPAPPLGVFRKVTHIVRVFFFPVEILQNFSPFFLPHPSQPPYMRGRLRLRSQGQSLPSMVLFIKLFQTISERHISFYPSIPAWRLTTPPLEIWIHAGQSSCLGPTFSR